MRYEGAVLWLDVYTQSSGTKCHGNVEQCSDDAAFSVLVYHLAGLLGVGNHSFNAFSP